jgi:hypothetical protein
MKQWLAVLAVVGSLILPTMVSADNDETDIPPEANWTPTPPTPAVIAVPEKRVVTTEQEQATDSPRPASVRRSSPLYLTEEDAKYQEVHSFTNRE